MAHFADPGRPAGPHVKLRKGGRETPRRRLLADRAARWIVSAGGIAIIASILGILIFILLEVWPLTREARVQTVRRLALPAAGKVGALLVDEHRTHAGLLDESGEARVVRLEDGRIVYSANVLAAAAEPPPEGAGAVLLDMKVPPERRQLAASTRDGRVVIKNMAFEVSFEGSERRVTPDGTPPVILQLDPEGRPVSEFSAQLDDEGNATAAGILPEGKLAVVRRSVEENMMTGETTESLARFEADVPGRVSAIVLDPDQRNLYAGTSSGDLLWWRLEDGQPTDLQVLRAGAPVTALDLLLGSRSLVGGQETGALSGWFAVRQPDERFQLTRI
ncbi:MAG TPA: hypothetical protein VE685_15030, partial [Thermoanaerobaculia bacterium]|nr:hypothetical protein [Thermoanaerobaculia bacterium]